MHEIQAYLAEKYAGNEELHFALSAVADTADYDALACTAGWLLRQALGPDADIQPEQIVRMAGEMLRVSLVPVDIEGVTWQDS